MPNDPCDSAGPAPRPEAPPCRVTVRRQGPILLDGPVEVELEDGTTVSSDRFRVALCTCRRSRRYPWCDTSHRRRAPGPSGGPVGGRDRTVPDAPG
ncbi:CDGSH iron-sulfur domain-containing protein [Streptomyces andamanensis]|uniref:CDGSH iron-sulfur domain-containing protein n=1 Tax=Streptomyces andamanensis TaxID=1565035 RepID=A0ABV8TQC2_9ACTN|nr:CDGSH iron-sulfur domain-containing protein [Streptomyces sp. Tu 6176]EYT82473.1 iron-binding protein [Streptomyces sp. Tu 6176]